MRSHFEDELDAHIERGKEIEIVELLAMKCHNLLMQLH